MTESTHPSTPKPGPRATSAGNVYYHKAHHPRSRSEPVRRVDSESETARQRQEKANPVHTAMMKSVRRFIIFSLAMLAILYLSVKSLLMVWQAKNNRILRSSAPVSPVAAETKTGTNSGSESAGAATVAPQRSDSEIDTESIRKAVFLAKRGEALEKSGNYKDAIARYSEALDLWPYLTDSWARLGALHLRMKDYAKAQSALETARQKNPTSVPTLNDLGTAYLLGGQTEKASKMFTSAIELDPEFAPGYFNMALCALARSDRAGARTYLERFLQLQPNDPRTLREIAVLDALGGHYEDAMKAIERALIEAPDWPLLHFDAAATAALLGQTDKAIHYLEQAEPLSSPATVYRFLQEPAFREMRQSEIGREFGKILARRARDSIAIAQTAITARATSEPLSSVSTDL